MADACAEIFGCCGICCVTILNAWCITQPIGTEGCGCCGPRGCCSCCKSSFDDDDFDERMKKEQAKNGISAAPVGSQPEASQGMSTATGDPKPTNDKGLV